MRGVVSIAAALAIPHTLENGQEFPGRDIVILLAFAVIFSTLVLQGLSLPYLVRWLGVKDDGVTHDEEKQARVITLNASLERLDEIALRENTCGEAVNRLRQSTLDRLKQAQRRIEGKLAQDDPVVLDALLEYKCEMIEAERLAVVDLRDRDEIGDEALRTIEHELDLEEARLVASDRGNGKS
jgi:CPA1 family monovalent cation:H+ antiporter